ncbi:PQQ-binding-like beta-propeller repeat protein [candidate division WOR-3 bacterium]|uniref:PQQ-binding-like beta-propeller repeat protein n=1 Tax=candidate division WOR-3 bacterium TaxID=2052148 RepID=A0A9D5K983_UNCW3|nr:PQQ-binding-like beta-propeller repeat protein [candidate division WOR-3 bacterium]MBD3363904.1 PQQ-binding-like beta-propeller repeat protein [candidate division WOR-3 bacterium]
MRRISRLVFAFVLIMCSSACEDELSDGDKGYISISSTPPGAYVYFDDSLTNMRTNCILEDIEPGSHSVGLYVVDSCVWFGVLNVSTGDTAVINATIEVEEGEVTWEYRNLTVYSNPIAIGEDGTLYIGTTLGLYALNSNRTPKWEFKISEKAYTPVVGSDGTVYFVAEDGTLYAVNANGDLKWKIVNTDGFSTPAIGSNGTIYVGSSDKNLYALSPEGEVIWQREFEITPGSPVIDRDGTLYVTPGRWVFAISPDNRIKWIFETPTGGGVKIPTIGSDGTVYFGSNDFYLYALSPDGFLKWSYRTNGWVHNTVVGSDGTIYVTADFYDYEDNPEEAPAGYIYAIDPAGNLKWGGMVTPYCIWSRSSPAIGFDGTVYIVASEYNHSTYLENAYLYAFTEDGELNWKVKLHSGYADVAYHIAIGADGMLYTCKSNSILYGIQTTSFGLADSPWPKYAHDNQNTGCACN